MSNIRQLSDHVTNLIAAGEVIEDAASVVKELVENAIDAGATVITVSLEESGLNEIRVVDNGCGMDAKDLEMCVLPHSTSKIFDEKDLYSIHTLGFRGEALASIVAVSNVRFYTSKEGGQGLMYSLKGGTPTTLATMAHDKGTEVIVRNLFFNTPARLQSLQSPATELSYVVDYVSKIALSQPQIAFSLSNNGKEILKTVGNGNLQECIHNLYGLDIAKNMVRIFDNDGIFKVDGFISNLSVTRASKKDIHFIVNGRMIRNSRLINAVIAGYQTMLMNNRYPIAVITIQVDPSLVDVNVHPSKLEVRFSEEQRLLDLITSSVSRILKSVDLTVTVSEDLPFDDVDGEEEDNNYEDNNYDQSDYNQNDYNQTEYNQPNYNQNDYNQNDYKSNDDILSQYEVANEQSQAYEYQNTETNNINPPFEQKEVYQQQQYNLFNENNEESVQLKYQLPKMYYIGQLFGTYILAQSENDFYIIDQHAAAERVNYEKLLSELEKEENIGYDLLYPFNLQFSPSDAIKVNEHMDEINNLGIVLEDFGGGAFTVRRIPIWIVRGSEQEFVEEIITQIIANTKKTKFEFLDFLAKQLACKKSIKGNEYHNALEIDYLLDDLAKTSNPYTCPHGRPVVIKFTLDQIEKWFKRIV